MMIAPLVPKVLIYLQPPLLNRFMVANWESTQLLHRRLSSSDLRVYLTTHWFWSCSLALVMFFIRVIEKKRESTESQSRALKYMNVPDAWQRPSVVGVCWVAVTMVLQRIGGPAAASAAKLPQQQGWLNIFHPSLIPALVVCPIAGQNTKICHPPRLPWFVQLVIKIPHNLIFLFFFLEFLSHVLCLNVSGWIYLAHLRPWAVLVGGNQRDR